MTPMSDDWTPTDTTWNNDQPQNTDWASDGDAVDALPGFDIIASIDRIDNDHMKLVANAVKDMNINVEDAAAMRVTAKMDTMDIASNFTESIRDFVNNGGDYAIVDWLDTMGKIL